MVEYQLPKLGVAGSIPVARFFLKKIMKSPRNTRKDTEKNLFSFCVFRVFRGLYYI